MTAETIQDWSNLVPEPTEEEGWQDEGSAQVDGWWAHETLAPIRGQLTRAFEVDDKQGKSGDKRAIVVVKLTHPTAARVPGAEKVDGKPPAPIRFEPGALIGVSVRTVFLDILQYVETQAMVYLKATGKKPVKDRPGQEYWMFDFKVQGQKGAPPRMAQHDGPPPPTDEIPF